MVKEQQTLTIWDNIKEQFINLANQASRSGISPNEINRQHNVMDFFPLFPLLNLVQENKIPFFYWQNRGNEEERLAFYPLEVLQGTKNTEFKSRFHSFKRILQCEDSNFSLYGGLRFNGYNFSRNAWVNWPGFYFMLPTFELIRTREKVHVFYHYNASSLKKSMKVLQLMKTKNYISEQSRIQPIHRNDYPTKKIWKQNIEKAIRHFTPNGLVKVVLARETEFQYNGEIPIQYFLTELQKHNTSSTYHFIFSPDGNEIFAGLSPERLYIRKKNIIISEAIAGTRRRGKSRAEDLALEEDLLSSKKDRFEHKLVMDSIENQFYFLCEEIKKSNAVKVIKLDHLQHLYCSFEGFLKEGVEEPDILEALHPTPAVGGFPKNAALQFLGENEPFDRGWYAAPIGWFNKDEAEFAVAIRSALFKSRAVYVYAGAGIVNGSDQEKEWDEIEDKITIFKKVLY